MEDFIRVMARMHTLDLDELGLAQYLAHVPTTAPEAALNEVDLALTQWEDFLAGYTEPLITYARRLAAPQRARPRSIGSRSCRATPGR